MWSFQIASPRLSKWRFLSKKTFSGIWRSVVFYMVNILSIASAEVTQQRGPITPAGIGKHRLAKTQLIFACDMWSCTCERFVRRASLLGGFLHGGQALDNHSSTMIFRQLGCVDMSTWKVPDGVVLTWKLYGMYLRMYLRMCRSGLIMCLNRRMHQHIGLARQVLATAGRCKRRPPRILEVLIQLQTSRIVHFERTPLTPRQNCTVLQEPWCFRPASF